MQSIRHFISIGHLQQRSSLENVKLGTERKYISVDSSPGLDLSSFGTRFGIVILNRVPQREIWRYY